MRRTDDPATTRPDLLRLARSATWLSRQRLACIALCALLPGAALAAVPDAPGGPAAPVGLIERAGLDQRTSGSVPRLDEAEALRVSEAAVGRMIPDVTLLDRQGRPVSLSSYRGKPLLVSFIYTGCFQVCPTQTRALHDAVRGLDVLLGPKQFNVVSIGFNQPFDSYQAMRAFAAQQRIDYPNWEFLSPTAAQVAPLTEAFGFSYLATPAGFDHVLGVTVVDAEGRIHSQVYGDRLRADQLGVPLRRILLDVPPPPTMSTLAAVVERVRILCTVYDKETGEYRYDYKLVFEIIGGALFFLTMAVYFLLEWRNRRRARRRVLCNQKPQASGSSA